MAVGYLWNLERRHREELASTVQVSITSYENDIAGGVVRWMSDGSCVPFRSLDQMVLVLELLLERSPEGAGSRCRTVGEKKRGDPAANPGRKLRSIPQNFRIRVYGREHHSLQGELRTESQRVCFRSSLELMRLIHQELGNRRGKAKQREPSVFLPSDACVGRHVRFETTEGSII